MYGLFTVMVIHGHARSNGKVNLTLHGMVSYMSLTQSMALSVTVLSHADFWQTGDIEACFRAIANESKLILKTTKPFGVNVHSDFYLRTICL